MFLINKKYTKIGLVFILGLSLVPVSAVSLNPKKELSFEYLPKGLFKRLSSSVFTTLCFAAGSLVAGLALSRKNAESIAFLGGLFGLVRSLDQLNNASADQCLEKFNLVYNDFLVEPLLNVESHSLWYSSFRASSGAWLLVDVVSHLSWLKRDLLIAIIYGEKLQASSLIQSYGQETIDTLSRKVAALRKRAVFAQNCIDEIKVDQLYEYQNSLKERYDVLVKTMEADRALAQVRDAYLNNQLEYVQSPYFIPVDSVADYCGICTRGINKSERYTTKCLCTPGSYFYHHGCVSDALKNNQNICRKCYSSATVHSAFGDGGVAAEPSLGQSYQTSPLTTIIRPYDRTQCVSCLGEIFPGKAYKTTCGCDDGKYSYHHECIKTKLSQRNVCPMCNVQNPAVHSNFGDGFSSSHEVQLQAFTQQTAPSAPPVDTLNTCAMCFGVIPQGKRYKTNCNSCQAKFYHHECIAGTLKSNGKRCPFCAHEDITVHSAF